MVITTTTRPDSMPAPDAARSPTSTVRGLVADRVAEHGVVLAGFYVVVVAVAGAASIALLAWPSHSDTYFSWDLGAPSTAATIGALYLASVVVFAVALTRPRREARSLNFGVLALALPTLWFTLSHRHVFDWNRPQAVAWVILFLTAPVSISHDLLTAPRAETTASVRSPTRIALWAAAVSGGGLAIALWFEASRSVVSENSPIPLVGLTGHYIGAWCAFVAASAATAAIGGRTGDARIVAVLLGSVSIGLLAATVRTSADLGPNVGVYVTALVGLAILAIVLHRSNRTPTTQAVEQRPRARIASKRTPIAAGPRPS